MTKTNKERITQLYDHLWWNNFDDYQILYPRGNAKDDKEKEVDADEWWEFHNIYRSGLFKRITIQSFC